jgi:DNA polymerase III subunit beta
MKLSIQREALLQPLQMVIGVVERRQTMPILSNVLIEVQKDKLITTATDIEVELASSIDLDTPPEKTGAITVSGRKLIDICRSLPAASSIELEEQGTNLIIKSNNSHFHLATLPVDEFPRTKEQPEKISFNVPQNELFTLVRRTHFAIAEHNPHSYLNGLLMEIKDGTLRAVASDAHRLSLYSIKNKSLENVLTRIIVPKKGVLELMRLLTEDEGMANISITKNCIRVQTVQATLTSKLIDSKYPPYSKMIPRGGDKRIEVERDTLKNALIRVGILSNELLRSMRLELSPQLLRLIANNSEQETAEEVLSVSYEGESLDIGFNIAYLLDVLSTIKTDKVVMTFKDSESGVIIEEINGNEDGLYIVMPFQL